MQIYAAASFFNHVSFESKLDGIQRRKLYTIIGRETGYEYILNPAGPEKICQAGGFPMTIIKEAAVTVDLRFGAFLKYVGDLLHLQGRDECSADGILDAVDWPEDLREAVESDDFTGLPAGMIGCKAAVVRRMPILGCDDEVEMRLQPIDNRHDLASFIDGQCAAGNKVVLNIDQYESIHLRRKVCAFAAMRQAILICLINTKMG